MRLVIAGSVVDVVDHRTATLRDLLALQDGTRRWVPGGLRQQRLEDLAQQAGRPRFADTPDGELWIGAVVFLSRRAAGHVGRVDELLDVEPYFALDEDDAPCDGTTTSVFAAGPGTTGARWPGDTRTRRNPIGATGSVGWPFDDVTESLLEWLGVVSHHWPGIHPLTVYDLPAHWWAYYVRAARGITDAQRERMR